jgi:lysophospholipase L1-like esterase
LRSYSRYPALILSAVIASACGGGSPAGPSGPGPTPTPRVETFPVTVNVFEDWDNDGVRAASERPLAGVEVSVALVKGVTDASGHVSLSIPRGTYLPELGLSAAPPYLKAVREVAVTAPQAAPLDLPLGYPIGDNRVGLYLAFGDSISSGDLSRDGSGYRGPLSRKLKSFYGKPIDIDYRGGSGGRTSTGADEVEVDMRQVRPSFTLIDWGVNDWLAGRCNPMTCDAIPNLRFIIQQVRNAKSLPVIATLTPSYAGYDSRVPPERNDWVVDMNNAIRDLAKQEGVLLADVYAAFDRNGGYKALIGDHLHPNDAGYEIMAQTWFDVITQARGSRALFTSAPSVFKAPSLQ